MSYRIPLQANELHIYHRPYTITKSEQQPYDSLLQWPSNAYFNKFIPDAVLLKRSLSTYKKPSYSISNQIFGSQKQQAYTNLHHLNNLLCERSKIHTQHLCDINHKHIQIQEKLFCVNINNFPDKVRRQSNLESQLLQLEQQKRDEELSFWKDSAELRDKIFEKAAEYKQAKHRYSVFSDVEAKYGG